MMKEYLQSEGYMPNDESFGISFRHQMKNYLFIDNDEDSSFFQLVMPGIIDVNDENRTRVYRAMDTTNASVKVAKASIFNDQVWISFEIMIDSTPVLGDIVPRALGILQHAYDVFGKNY